MSRPTSIDSLWIFTMKDAEGIPGLLIHMSADGVMMPMLGSDLERIQALRPIAQKIATSHNVSITLSRFTNRTDLAVIEP
jgi:hypothetical protein